MLSFKAKNNKSCLFPKNCREMFSKNKNNFIWLKLKQIKAAPYNAGKNTNKISRGNIKNFPTFAYLPGKYTIHFVTVLIINIKNPLRAGNCLGYSSH